MSDERDPEVAISKIKDAGYRLTPQRRAVVREVMGLTGHINPAELAERVTKNLPGVNAATVYRTLRLLDELDILKHTHLEEGVTYHHSSHSAHVHLVCSRCGSRNALAQAEVDSMAHLMESAHGFAPDFTHFAIAGLCENCRLLD